MSTTDLAGPLFLARCLPRGAARRLGAAYGRRAGRFSAGARRRGLANLRAAFPDLDPGSLARLTRDAWTFRATALFDGASACRYDARTLCRHLTLERWSRLATAAGGETGGLVLGAGFGCWQLAALAVALYRGPIETLGRWRGDPVFGRLAASFEQRSGRRLFGELAGGGHAAGGQVERKLERTLRAGGCVGFLADRAAGHGETVEVPFLGATARAETLVATVSIATGAPVVPVFGRLLPRGGWRVEAREPIDPRGADARTLTARYLDAVEREVRRRPELWLGWWRHDCRYNTRP